jgi:hypothetical protein
VKIYEEAHELLAARTPDEVEGELADLLEVVRGLAASTGVNWDDVLARADAKRKKRGGFETGTVLLETAWPKGSDPTKEQTRSVPLSSLAHKTEGTSPGLNYAALLAKGTDRTLQLPDGSRIQISLSGFGVSIRLLGTSRSDGEQIGLPGLDTNADRD